MAELLTLEQVIEEVNAYFDSGKGNAAIRESIINHMIINKQVPPAVLATLSLVHVNAWARKGDA